MSREKARTPLTPGQQELAAANMGLVGEIINRMTGRQARRFGEPLADRRNSQRWDDLWSAGCVGLCKAAGTFRPELGFKFSTFAWKWIRKYVKHELRKGPGFGPGGSHLPHLGYDVEGESPDVEALADLENSLDVLKGALATMPENHRRVMVGLFLEGKSGRELALAVDVSRQRIDQLKVEGLAWLRVAMEPRKGKDAISRRISMRGQYSTRRVMVMVKGVAG